MADFDTHIDALVEKEGGWRLIDVPGDRGGRTYGGISQRANPDWSGWRLIDGGAPDREVRQAVRDRYLFNYWAPIMGQKIESAAVAEIMLSCAVLSGPRNAVVLAQTAAGTAIDGIMGPSTLEGINTTPEREFCAVFALARLFRFADIVNADRHRTHDQQLLAREGKGQLKFLLGWINRVKGEL